MIKKKIVYQKQIKQYHEHCCVPECTGSSKYNGTLSFHSFPSDESLRRVLLEFVANVINWLHTARYAACILLLMNCQRLSRKELFQYYLNGTTLKSPHRDAVCGTGWKDSPLCRLQNPWSALFSPTTTIALSLNLQAWIWQRLKMRNSKKKFCCYAES